VRHDVMPRARLRDQCDHNAARFCTGATSCYETQYRRADPRDALKQIRAKLLEALRRIRASPFSNKDRPRWGSPTAAARRTWQAPCLWMQDLLKDVDDLDTRSDCEAAGYQAPQAQASFLQLLTATCKVLELERRIARRWISNWYPRVSGRPTPAAGQRVLSYSRHRAEPYKFAQDIRLLQPSTSVRNPSAGADRLQRDGLQRTPCAPSASAPQPPRDCAGGGYRDDRRTQWFERARI
jgi:hypothetical protein